MCECECVFGGELSFFKCERSCCLDSITTPNILDRTFDVLYLTQRMTTWVENNQIQIF